MNLSRLSRERVIEFRFERDIGLSHTESNAIRQWQVWGALGSWNRNQGKWSCLFLDKITSDGSPDNGDLDFTIRNCLDQLSGRAVFSIIAKDAITNNVVDNSFFSKDMRGRTVCVIVSDQMNADFHVLQGRIIKRDDLMPFGFRSHK